MGIWQGASAAHTIMNRACVRVLLLLKSRQPFRAMHGVVGWCLSAVLLIAPALYRFEEFSAVPVPPPCGIRQGSTIALTQRMNLPLSTAQLPFSVVARHCHLPLQAATAAKCWFEGVTLTTWPKCYWHSLDGCKVIKWPLVCQ